MQLALRILRPHVKFQPCLPSVYNTVTEFTKEQLLEPSYPQNQGVTYYIIVLNT